MPYTDRNKQREYVRNWMRIRRSAWITEHGPCVFCGGTEDLQIDHKDPKKKISHKVWSWSKQRRDRELEKCQVVCKSCHLAKSIAEGSVTPPTHGSESRYRHGGCRCDLCRAGHAARMRYYRSRVKLRGEGIDPSSQEELLREQAQYQPSIATRR